MKNRAFTLIELLVVVLIIGILAAVALPQYQRAVKKSRAAEAKIALSALVRASEVACLADPNYSGDMSSLDVNVQNSSHWHYENNECLHENGHSGCSWSAINLDDPIVLTAHSEEYLLANDVPTWAKLSCVATGGSFSVEEMKKQCSAYGFTKTSEESEEAFVEP